MRLFWAITMLGGVLGGVIIFFTGVIAKGAPQEAAGYAMACAVAIVPYVFARSVQELFGLNLGESTKRIVDAITKANGTDESKSDTATPHFKQVEIEVPGSGQS